MGSVYDDKSKYDKALECYSQALKIRKESGGIRGLYRGLAPGSWRSFTANGTAMVVMQYCQKKVTEWGLRDD
jgi:solute carrier family 25 carnitine/acylcarnitine transporter 20/29